LVFGFHQKHSPPQSIEQLTPGLLYALGVNIDSAYGWIRSFNAPQILLRIDISDYFSTKCLEVYFSLSSPAPSCIGFSTRERDCFYEGGSLPDHDLYGKIAIRGTRQVFNVDQEEGDGLGYSPDEECDRTVSFSVKMAL
jgi:hypothetical protein